jgi:hypothetical protein
MTNVKRFVLRITGLDILYIYTQIGRTADGLVIRYEKVDKHSPTQLLLAIAWYKKRTGMLR